MTTKRKINEDSYVIKPELGLYIIADGMGGHERGAEASRMIIDVLKSYFKPDKLESELKDITAVEGIPAEVNGIFALIDMGIRDANKVVFEKNRDEGLERYMGSTLVGFILTENLYIIWFNVGDSRLYRFRDGTLSQLTEDHSAYTEWLNRGRIGDEPSKSIITRAVGPKEGVIPDMNWEKGKKEDIYLLCSDGLHDQVSDDEISDIEQSFISGYMEA